MDMTSARVGKRILLARFFVLPQVQLTGDKDYMHAPLEW